jgi:hypothetical protein
MRSASIFKRQDRFVVRWSPPADSPSWRERTFTRRAAADDFVNGLRADRTGAFLDVRVHASAADGGTVESIAEQEGMPVASVRQMLSPRTQYNSPAPNGRRRDAFGFPILSQETFSGDTIRGWLLRRAIREFSARDCWNDVRRSFGDDIWNLWPALEALVGDRVLERIPDPQRPGPGRRPSPRFRVLASAPVALYDDEVPPTADALEASLGIAPRLRLPQCPGCSRPAPEGGLCRGCLADEAR